MLDSELVFYNVHSIWFRSQTVLKLYMHIVPIASQDASQQYKDTKLGSDIIPIDIVHMHSIGW